MGRRRGQVGNVVVSGKWYKVRWREDVEGQHERVQRSEKVAPLIGAPKFDKKGQLKVPPAVALKAKEIVECSGCNSEERFSRVVLGEKTFGEQAKWYLHWVQTRDRRPIKDTSSLQAALNKWILPEIGELLLRNVHNMSVKPLVTKLKQARLSPKTVNHYVTYIGQVVASLKNERTGEPIHYRKWDASVMDLPIVRAKTQRRPALKAGAINTLVSESEGDEQALYVLLAATGLRVSEALALETKHFINGGRTIQVCQQIDRDHPRIVPYTKTDAGSREVDLSTEVAEYLRAFINGKDGLLFRTRNSTPYLHNNLEQRWLTPHLQTMGLDEKGVFTPFGDSARHGCVLSAVRKTSRTTGWATSPRP